MANTSDDISQYNLDELHAPSWLNKEFFEMVLKQHENTANLKVEKFEITPGTGKSDHYASVMFRAKINYSIETGNDCDRKYISLIIKTTPETECMKMNILQEFSLFKTEIMMYAEVLPKIEQELKSIEKNSEQLYPKMIYSSMNPRECIIFEDLVEKNYAVVSKRNCTMHEVISALNKLARLHAASYKLIQNGDTTIRRLKSSYSKKAFEKFDVMQEGIPALKEILASKDDLKMYIQHIENIEDSLLDDIDDYFNLEKIHQRGGILVLTHGDFHSRNIMVQYKDEVLKNVMLVDFQISFYGSAVFDLMYASVLLLSPEMRMKHREEIFSKYIEMFQTTLKQLNYTGKIPTNSDFEDEWKIYKRWEFFLIANYLVFSYAVAEGNIPLSDIVEKPEVRRKIWNNEKIAEEICVHFKRMLKNGSFF